MFWRNCRLAMLACLILPLSGHAQVFRGSGALQPPGPGTFDRSRPVARGGLPGSVDPNVPRGPQGVWVTPGTMVQSSAAQLGPEPGITFGPGGVVVAIMYVPPEWGFLLPSTITFPGGWSQQPIYSPYADWSF